MSHTSSFVGNKKYTLHKITKLFFDKEKITLLSTKNLNKYIKELIECIKNDQEINLKEEFSFNKMSAAHSKRGCITQSKKINEDERLLRDLLLSIGAKPKGASLLEIKDQFFICVDNFEIYKKNRIAYEINSSNSYNSLRSLAGKILLYKRFNDDVKFVVILNNPKILNNTSFNLLKEISDSIILRKNLNKEYLREVREKLIFC